MTLGPVRVMETGMVLRLGVNKVYLLYFSVSCEKSNTVKPV